MADFESTIGSYAPPTKGQKLAKGLREWAHRFAMVPFIGSFLLFPAMTALATAVDTFDGFANRSVANGAKSLISGTVDTVVTAVVAPISWWLPTNWVFSLATGDSLPELARKGTLAALDTIIPERNPAASGSLGNAPATNGYIPASTAFISNMQPYMGTAQRGPNGQMVAPYYWSNGVANQRGMDPDAARAAWINQNSDDYRALRAAAEQSRQPTQREAS